MRNKKSVLMTLKVNCGCFSGVAGIAGNVFGLGEGAEPKSQIEVQMFKIKNEC
jgi:hypothetical protein